MFYGREQELRWLQKLRQKKTSSLVCVLGRRRIGKSTLIEEYGRKFPYFFSLQGLAPENSITNATQLGHFSKRLSYFFKKEPILFESWSQAFLKLAEYSQKKEILIFLDEISWMGRLDPAFASALKEAWDIAFKKNPKLVLVLCGSVSTWIEDNILKNQSFEGRVSLTINLTELELPEINKFWTENNFKATPYEKMMVLSVTGGIPKYIEEILDTETSEKNLMRLCFTKEGFLFNDFSRIFTEIFERKSATLEQIVRKCLVKRLSPVELAHSLKKTQNSELTNYIHILETAGFLSRDYYYKPDGKISKGSHLRVKDNYLRFYIKNIEPVKDQIIRGGRLYKSFESIQGIENLMGFQFENLILANRQLLNKFLELDDSEILFSSPYRQNKTLANRGACQIDLLIGGKFNNFYVCEFKCKKWIEKSIIKEVQKKCETIDLPKRTSTRPVLVYEGEIYPPHLDEIKKYFFRLIRFEDLLNYKG